MIHQSIGQMTTPHREPCVGITLSRARLLAGLTGRPGSLSGQPVLSLPGEHQAARAAIQDFQPPLPCPDAEAQSDADLHLVLTARRLQRSRFALDDSHYQTRPRARSRAAEGAPA